MRREVIRGALSSGVRDRGCSNWFLLAAVLRTDCKGQGWKQEEHLEDSSEIQGRPEGWQWELGEAVRFWIFLKVVPLEFAVKTGCVAREWREG